MSLGQTFAVLQHFGMVWHVGLFELCWYPNRFDGWCFFFFFFTLFCRLWNGSPQKFLGHSHKISCDHGHRSNEGTQAQLVATTFATANEWDGAAATAATAAAVASRSSSGSNWIEWDSFSIWIGDAKDFHFKSRSRRSLRKWTKPGEITRFNWKPRRISKISIIHPHELRDFARRDCCRCSTPKTRLGPMPTTAVRDAGVVVGGGDRWKMETDD